MSIIVLKTHLFVIFFILKPGNGDRNYVQLSKYNGTSFPAKYLVVDDRKPTENDLHNYLIGLNRTVSYFSLDPNNTNCNTAVGMFLMKTLLKRALLDDSAKISSCKIEIILYIIKQADFILSHYIYINKPYGWRDIEFRVSFLFKEDAPQVYSIADFNVNRLKPWLFRQSNINAFVESFDNITLPKRDYVELVELMDQYYINLDESDECISRVAYQPEPIDVTTTQKCRLDPYCYGLLHSSPSVAYALSHRYFNILLLRTVRRCYLESKYEDDQHMDMLCAEMYREAVYIARRGFFARDLFLEHVALCSIRGYGEFHRTQWFRKVISWMDENGCIREFDNYEINRTTIHINRTNQDDKENIKRVRRLLRNILYSDCHEHPMALLIIVLGHAVRHGMHFMTA